MQPRLVSCWFGVGDQGDRYRRLAAVLEYTARKHCPDWSIEVAHLKPPEFVSSMNNPSHVWNTQKLDHWVRAVVDAPDGDRLLLIDGDMVVMKPLGPIWDRDFDIAYTVREQTRLPLNGGVIFVRVSDKTRGFMQKWWETNLRFLNRAADHRYWRQRYAGINQASLGFMLEKVDHGCAIAKIPCSEWNLCEWRLYEPEKTRVIHIKSALRRAVFGIAPAAPHHSHRPLVSLWREIEKEAVAWQKQQAGKTASTDTGATQSTSVVA